MNFKNLNFKSHEFQKSTEKQSSFLWVSTMNETCCVFDKMFGKYNRGNPYNWAEFLQHTMRGKNSENKWKTVTKCLCVCAEEIFPKTDLPSDSLSWSFFGENGFCDKKARYNSIPMFGISCTGVKNKSLFMCNRLLFIFGWFARTWMMYRDELWTCFW